MMDYGAIIGSGSWLNLSDQDLSVISPLQRNGGVLICSCAPLNLVWRFLNVDLHRCETPRRPPRHEMPDAQGPELSTDCQEKRKAAHKRAEELREGCTSDAEEFCLNIKPCRRRILACLTHYEAELSQDCKEVMPHQQ